MSRFSHNCELCRPKPIVIFATDKADALRMIGKAKRVIVCIKSCIAMFAITKKEARKEIDRLADRHMPRVSRLLGSTSVFIE